MPRPKKLVPSLQHHKSTGQARVRLSDGTVRYLGKWNSKDARTGYARLVAELTATGTTSTVTSTHDRRATGDGPTVSDVILAWLEHAERRYRKHGNSTGTLFSFKASLKTLRELYHDTPAAAFGPLKLETVRAKLAEPYFDDAQKRDRRRSRGVVNARTRGIVAIFKWAASRELVPPTVPMALATLGPIRRGELPLAESRHVGPVSDADIDATLPFLSQVVGDMVRLGRVTGMRPGEIVLIRPTDIDRSGRLWKYVPTSHKLEHHDQQREVYIGPRGQAILAPYLLRPAESFCFSPGESIKQHRERRHAKRKTRSGQGNGPGTNVKRKPKKEPGERFDVHSFRRAITSAAKLAGVPKWGPNQLRHTFATDARAAGGLESVQGLLGHSNLKTSEIYAERQAGLARDVALKIG